jgi:hypothetical protein
MWKLCIVALAVLFLIGCGSEEKPIPAGEPAPVKPADEKAAIEALGKAIEAQSFYYKRNRRYALTFDELIEARDLVSEPTVDQTGYNFTLRPTADAQSYRIFAAPGAQATNTRYFYTDQTGVIRAETAKEATVESPPVPK